MDQEHDIIAESKLSLSGLARHVLDTTGQGIDPSTCWRWCREGIVRSGKRITLQYCRVGRKILTSKEAFSRFARELAAADTPKSGWTPRSAAQVRSDERRQKDIAAAEARLQAAGI